MGVGPSVGDFLRATDDEGLAQLMTEAFQVDPARMEQAVAVAKQRCVRVPGGDALPSSTRAPPTAAETAFDPAPQAALGLPTEAHDESTPKDDGKDPTNALWAFEGHRLLKLRPAIANPSHGEPDAAPEVDADGHAVLYGSCGRDKRYARCSVCYFRGLRCNTGHYCACCQRPVCIRPRTYPGEQHPKICWNVLHVDEGMLQRVERKKRRLQAAGGGAVHRAVSSRALVASTIPSEAMGMNGHHTGHKRRVQGLATATVTETHRQGDAGAMDADARPELPDALSTAVDL